MTNLDTESLPDVAPRDIGPFTAEIFREKLAECKKMAGTAITVLVTIVELVREAARDKTAWDRACAGNGIEITGANRDKPELLITHHVFENRAQRSRYATAAKYLSGCTLEGDDLVKHIAAEGGVEGCMAKQRAGANPSRSSKGWLTGAALKELGRHIESHVDGEGDWQIRVNRSSENELRFIEAVRYQAASATDPAPAPESADVGAAPAAEEAPPMS